MGFAGFIFLPWCSLHRCSRPVNSQHFSSPSTACPTTPYCKELPHLEEAEESFLLLTCILICWKNPSLLTPLYYKPFLSWGCTGTGALAITALKQASCCSACNAALPWVPLSNTAVWWGVREGAACANTLSNVSINNTGVPELQEESQFLPRKLWVLGFWQMFSGVSAGVYCTLSPYPLWNFVTNTNNILSEQGPHQVYETDS